MQITDIQPGKRDPKRVNVYLDGKFAFAVSQELKILNKLQINGQITQENLEKLIFEDQTNRLFEKALKFLSFRPRSKKEIKDNLIQKLRLTDKGEEEKKTFEKSVENVLKKLEKIGQINDAEFANWWVEQRTRFKKASQRIIKSELLSKGLDRDTIETALTKIEIDPVQTATEAAQKKLSSYQKLEPKDFKIKLSRYLGARGFDWEVIKKVVDTLSKKEVE